MLKAHVMCLVLICSSWFFILLFHHAVAVSNDDLLGRDETFLFKHLLFNKLNKKRLEESKSIKGFFFSASHDLEIVAAVVRFSPFLRPLCDRDRLVRSASSFRTRDARRTVNLWSRPPKNFPPPKTSRWRRAPHVRQVTSDWCVTREGHRVTVLSSRRR